MTTPAGEGATPAQPDEILGLARRHGLDVAEILDINELGLDFRVATGVDRAGTRWMLRIPRRPDVLPKIAREARTLRFLAPRVPFALPDWRVVGSDLVAYPRLDDRTAMAIDGVTWAPTWQIDPESDRFPESLAKALVALHSVPTDAAIDAGLPHSSSPRAREAIRRDLETVAQAFTVARSLRNRWQAWLDDDTSWPEFATVVHGDLYVGHVLVDSDDRVTGMIDWTEAEVGDPSIDFCGHLTAFGSAGLEQLVTAYQRYGGRTWPRMVHHITERTAAAPIKYALFALASGDARHLDAVKAQLGTQATPGS
ncbi:MAG: macrolide 2'-phosphotransferase [Gemmatimonadales bacterium]|nr:macrolide 2'-phosphotransferase [Gemmatimonadales bacterium]